MEPPAESNYEKFARLCREAAARGSLSPEHLARLAERSEPEVLAGVIANPYAPRELAEHLVQRADAMIAKLALEEASLPLRVALKFAEHRLWYVRSAAAQFRGAPVELLHLLALDPDDDVRLAVAGNPTASAALLIDLAHDPCDEVRHAVVRNVSTPMKAIRQLANDQDLTIRTWIALNRKLPADLFEKLRKYEHDAVRCSLAANRNLTDSQLQRLSRDASDRVRSAVARRLADAELLTNLSSDPALSVRLAVFQNFNTPADIRNKLEIELGTREKQIAAFKKEVFRDLGGPTPTFLATKRLTAHRANMPGHATIGSSTPRLRLRPQHERSQRHDLTGIESSAPEPSDSLKAPGSAGRPALQHSSGSEGGKKSKFQRKRGDRRR